MEQIRRPQRPQIPMTQHERAVLGALRLARTADTTPEPARAAIDAAQREWQRGRLAGPDLLSEERHDLDARLWVIRLDLLERLSRSAPPEGPSLAELLELGDGTPAGWRQAVEVALAAATDSERLRPARSRRRGRGGDADTVLEALALFAADPLAFVPDLTQLELPTHEGLISSGAPQPWSPQRAVELLQSRRLMVRYQSSSGSRVEHPGIAPAEWRAWSALLAGLFAVERLALPAQRLAFARERLLRATVALAAEVTAAGTAGSGRRIVEQLVRELDKASPGGAHRRPPLSARWVWPAAFAVVVGALDRYAGAGGEPLPEEVAPGTRVELLDGDGERRGRGTVLAEEEARRARYGSRWMRPAQRARSLPVLLDGQVRRWPREVLRTAPRAQLFA